MSIVESIPLELVVLGREQAADRIVALTLGRRDGGPLPAWEPGAHIDLVLPNGLVRQFSLCGSPQERRTWRIGVLHETDSRGGSAYLHENLGTGQTVTVRGLRNNFHFRPAGRLLFVAGGIGITPLLPMLEAAEAAAADWRLVYLGRSPSTMAFLDELARYAGKVQVHASHSAGRLDLLAVTREADLYDAIYCCGPSGLIEGLRDTLAEHHRSRLHVEYFSAGPADDAPSGEFDVQLASSGVTVRVASGQSILEAVEAAGFNPPCSCREGTCGSCEARVISGRPDHRDHVLSDAEKETGDTMMICVSRSKDPLLVLDL